MTKAEILEAISTVPDDPEILVEPWPESAGKKGPAPGELVGIALVEVFEATGSDDPAFASIRPKVSWGG